MGYMIAHGFCCACKRQISFNPNRVPSLNLEGSREPLCRSCFDIWNEIHRTSKGLPAIPLPERAYEAEPDGLGDECEACWEEELEAEREFYREERRRREAAARRDEGLGRWARWYDELAGAPDGEGDR